MVTGGYSGQYETRTTFINTATDRVTPGPALQKGRVEHGCHEISIQGHPYIIVGGGYSKSTEVLDKWNVNQGWTEGKQKSNIFIFKSILKARLFFFILVADMPEKVFGHSMVASPGNEAVYSFGGYVIGAKNKIFKFSCPDDQIQNCQWEEMGTRLTYPRRYSVAMTIPDDLANKLC